MPEPGAFLPIDRSVAAIRSRVRGWKAGGERVALIPTMGALHDGHLALVQSMRARADRAVVSIFVNPKQFGPNEDFAAYPRHEAEDVAMLAAIGADAVFAPQADAIYPPGDATTVHVGGPALGLEADFRPHFFTGVATVVAKLLLAVEPDLAVFGEKDFQQLAVLRRMSTDLVLPVEIVGHPTIRESDGLAYSSRNAYLSPEERKTAPQIFATLTGAVARITAGQSPSEALAAARSALAAAGFRVDYLELRDAVSLAQAIPGDGRPLRLLVAAWLGRTRLIDNIAA